MAIWFSVSLFAWNSQNSVESWFQSSKYCKIYQILGFLVRFLQRPWRWILRNSQIAIIIIKDKNSTRPETIFVRSFSFTQISFRVSAKKSKNLRSHYHKITSTRVNFYQIYSTNARCFTYLKETNGLLVEGISEQNMGYLNAYCGLKSINLNDLVAVLIHDWFGKLNSGLLHTDTPIFDNAVNSS